MQILLAESIPLNQRVSRLIGAKLGQAVDIIFEGVTAVEAATRTRYALVSMEVEVPNMDGFEAARCILSHLVDTNQHPYTIALTANAQRADCPEADMNDYLQKSVRAADLARTQAHALASAATWRSQRRRTNR